MNSLEIQYFLTIVRYGSFTEAAQALSVSQPAISKQIRLLEAELDCSLFARSGRTLSLTEAGQAYHTYFQQCRFQLDLLKNKLEEQKKGGKPTLRIAYPEDVDPSYFRDKIQAASAALETPVHLEFSCYPESELVNRLLDRQTDLILTGEMPAAANFSAAERQKTSRKSQHSQAGTGAASGLPLSLHHFDEVPQILLYASSRHEAADISDSRNEAADISDFRNDTFLFSETDAALQSSQNLYPLFEDFGFAPKIRFAANLSTILDLTAQDEGVYLTHAWCRGCKRPEYRTLVLPSTKRFYLACDKSRQNPEISGCATDASLICNAIKELFQMLTKNQF